MHIVDLPNSGGKRMTGLSPNEAQDGPRITVVTAVFNGIDSLEQTIQSVFDQTYSNVEYIIVDGGSTDGTVDLIRKHEDRIDFWISEPDKGVYDAFNKSGPYATGEWTIFLGAGDRFCNPEVLSIVAETLRGAPPDAELAYGRVSVAGPSHSPAKILNRPWEEMRGRWLGGRPVLPHHQGVLHRRKLLAQEAPFDTSYGIVADSKLVYQSLQRTEPIFCDAVIAVAPLGGVSTDPKYFLRTAHEIMKLNRELGYGNYTHQLWFYLKTIGKVLLYRVSGETKSKRLIDEYRVMTGRGRKWT